MDASVGIRDPATRRWLLLSLVGVLGLGGFLAFAISSAGRTQPTSPLDTAAPVLSAGSPAPDFTARLIGGSTLHLAALRGTPVILNFFASWCPNCVGELGSFAAVARQSAGSVAFVGIDSNDGSGTAAAALARKTGISYPIALDEHGGIASRFRISALPVTFFLDASGRVRGEVFGAVPLARLKASVRVLEARRR